MTMCWFKRLGNATSLSQRIRSPPDMHYAGRTHGEIGNKTGTFDVFMAPKMSAHRPEDLIRVIR